jgi:ATP-dependent DNA helicase RecQ
MGKLEDFLQKKYGYPDFKDGQKQVIQALLAQQNTLALLATGTGKSLCYQFYGKYTKQRVLIISPLLSLMQDQVEQMRYNGEKRVIALNSMLTASQRKIVLQHLKQYQYVYSSPEILQNQEVMQALRKLKWGLLAIDEAHCISQWGPDFRPDYLQLGNLRKKLANPLTLVLSATVTPKIQIDIIETLAFDTKPTIIKRSVNRENIYLACEKYPSEKQKADRLLTLVASLTGPGLIYFSSKKKANEFSDLIRTDLKLPCSAYHADLELSERYKIQQQFIKNQLQVVCATSAFGMGINKKDIRYVIHYHLSANVESYLQEIGRAGRDGKESLALLLYTPNDIDLQRKLSLDTIPDKVEIANYYCHPMTATLTFKQELLKYYYDRHYKLDEVMALFEQRLNVKRSDLSAMQSYIDYQGCKRQYLLKYFGETKDVKHDERCCQVKGSIDMTKFNDVSVKMREKLLIPSYSEILAQIFAI